MTSILVPTDGSIAAEKALNVAIELAQARNARVELFHVLLADKEPAELLQVPGIEPEDTLAAKLKALAHGPETARSVSDIMRQPDLPARPVPDDVLQQIGTRILERSRRMVEDSGVPVGVLEIGAEAAAPAIVAAAKAAKADTIVMGMRGLRTIDAFTFGSVSQQVCGSASCTCIAVH